MQSNSSCNSLPRAGKEVDISSVLQLFFHVTSEIFFALRSTSKQSSFISSWARALLACLLALAFFWPCDFGFCCFDAGFSFLIQQHQLSRHVPITPASEPFVQLWQSFEPFVSFRFTLSFFSQSLTSSYPSSKHELLSEGAAASPNSFTTAWASVKSLSNGNLRLVLQIHDSPPTTCTYFDIGLYQYSKLKMLFFFNKFQERF